VATKAAVGEPTSTLLLPPLTVIEVRVGGGVVWDALELQPTKADTSSAASKKDPIFSNIVKVLLLWEFTTVWGGTVGSMQQLSCQRIKAVASEFQLLT
jgi:hypothetical protein